MHSAIPLSLAVLVAVGILVIGGFYIVSPERILGGFRLKPPASDADTLAWLRLKGIRDVASGLAVLTLLLTTNSRTVGIVLLVFAFIPFGDMVNVLMSGGAKGRSLLHSWRDLRGHARRGPAPDPCNLTSTLQVETVPAKDTLRGTIDSPSEVNVMYLFIKESDHALV